MWFLLALLLLLGSVFAILGLFWYPVNIQIIFSRFLRSVVSLFIIIALDIHASFWIYRHFTILILPPQEHGESLHFLNSFTISFWSKVIFVVEVFTAWLGRLFNTGCLGSWIILTHACTQVTRIIQVQFKILHINNIHKWVEYYISSLICYF